MVAPIDASARLTVDDETFTLRYNFRTLKLAKSEGVNLMSGEALDPLDLAVAMRCLMVADHPDMTDELAFALTVKSPEACVEALTELMSKVVPTGPGGAVGNAKAPTKAKRAK